MHTAHQNSKDQLGDINDNCARHSQRRRKNKKTNSANASLSYTLTINTANNTKINEATIHDSSKDTQSQVSFNKITRITSRESHKVNFNTSSNNSLDTHSLKTFFERKSKSSILIAQLCDITKTNHKNTDDNQSLGQYRPNNTLEDIILFSELSNSDHTFIAIITDKITSININQIRNITNLNKKLITFLVFDLLKPDIPSVISHLSILNCSLNRSSKTTDSVTPRDIYRHIVENLAPNEQRPAFFTNTPEGAEFHRHLT